MRAHAPPIQHVLHGIINVAYTSFNAEKDIMDTSFGVSEEQNGGGGSNQQRPSPDDVALRHALR